LFPGLPRASGGRAGIGVPGAKHFARPGREQRRPVSAENSRLDKFPWHMEAAAHPVRGSGREFWQFRCPASALLRARRHVRTRPRSRGSPRRSTQARVRGALGGAHLMALGFPGLPRPGKRSGVHRMPRHGPRKAHGGDLGSRCRAHVESVPGPDRSKGHRGPELRYGPDRPVMLAGDLKELDLIEAKFLLSVCDILRSGD